MSTKKITKKEEVKEKPQITRKDVFGFKCSVVTSEWYVEKIVAGYEKCFFDKDTKVVDQQRKTILYILDNTKSKKVTATNLNTILKATTQMLAQSDID